MAKVSGRTRSNSPDSNPQLKGVGNTSLQTEHPGSGSSYASLNWEREAKAIMMTKGGLSSSEADEAFSAIRRWAGTGYVDIRSWQLGRLSDKDKIEKSERRATVLEDFIDKMPKWAGGTTYRGILSWQKRQLFESLEVGDQWDACSLNSWSSSLDIGYEFAENGGKKAVILRCKAPQNGTSIKNIGGLTREYEVLTSSRCRYNIVGKSYDKVGTLIVDLEPISNGKARKKGYYG